MIVLGCFVIGSDIVGGIVPSLGSSEENALGAIAVCLVEIHVICSFKLLRVLKALNDMVRKIETTIETSASVAFSFESVSVRAKDEMQIESLVQS